MAESNCTMAQIDDTPDNAVRHLFQLWLTEKDKESPDRSELDKIESCICMMLAPEVPAMRHRQTAKILSFPTMH